MALESDTHAISRRKALKVSVAALCAEVGFEKTEESAIETLTEMLQSFLSEVGKSSRAFAELAGRTEGMMTDVVMSLIEMGQRIDSIPAHAKRSSKSVLLPPNHCSAPPTLKTLQAGDKQKRPSHVPDYLPQFPDPHTYIRSSTQKAPVTDYQIIREKAASQKRDVERALTRFIAKTGETQSLFKDDTGAFPLIAVKPSPFPYLDALLPKDQDLDAQEPTEVQITEKKKRRQDLDGESIGSGDQTVDNDSIDNPYLRPVKMYRYKKK